MAFENAANAQGDYLNNGRLADIAAEIADTGQVSRRHLVDAMGEMTEFIHPSQLHASAIVDGEIPANERARMNNAVSGAQSSRNWIRDNLPRAADGGWSVETYNEDGTRSPLFMSAAQVAPLLGQLNSLRANLGAGRRPDHVPPVP